MRYSPSINQVGLPSLADIEASLPDEEKLVLEAARQSMEDAYNGFAIEIPDGLHSLLVTPLPVGTKAVLEKIFRQRLGAFRTIWRALEVHFDELGEATCPYCNFGEQWEHDHYLPKSVFPEFALYPLNLVPICKPCNGKKLAQYKKNGERIFVYAPAELQNVEGLLAVRVTYGDKPKISYSVTNPGNIAADTFSVVERHFETLGLRRRYAKFASAAVARLRREFRTPESIALGKSRMRSRLRRMAEDRRIQCPPNHWEAQLLACLASTDEFTDHVFS